MVNMHALMQKAQAMQKKMEDLQEQLGNKEVEGSAGGGMVKLVLTGKNDLRRINIDASLLKADEKEVLEDLIIAAFNDAKSKVDANFTEQLNKLTSGMGLPPGMKLPF